MPGKGATMSNSFSSLSGRGTNHPTIMECHDLSQLDSVRISERISINYSVCWSSCDGRNNNNYNLSNKRHLNKLQFSEFMFSCTQFRLVLWTWATEIRQHTTQWNKRQQNQAMKWGKRGASKMGTSLMARTWPLLFLTFFSFLKKYLKIP